MLLSNIIPSDIFQVNNITQNREAAQLRFRGWLQKHVEKFEAKRLYPGLSTLIELHHSLEKAISGQGELMTALQEKQPLAEIKLLDGVLSLEHKDLDNDVFRSKTEDILSFLEWALPYVLETIDSGRKLYEEIEESIEISWIGIIPRNTSEGFLFIPSPATREFDRMLILSYKQSFVRRKTEDFGRIAVEQIKAVSAQDPGEAKEKFLSKRSSWSKVFYPNPATALVTAPAYPLRETVLPIVKRSFFQFLKVDELLGKNVAYPLR